MLLLLLCLGVTAVTQKMEHGAYASFSSGRFLEKDATWNTKAMGALFASSSPTVTVPYPLPHTGGHQVAGAAATRRRQDTAPGGRYLPRLMALLPPPHPL